MSWKPRLVVRFSRGGGISSPTSSAGYALFGGMATAMSCGFVFAAISGQPFLLFGLVATGIFVRDAWAWFAATEEERREFRAEVARLQSLGHGRPPDQQFIGGNWGAGAFVLLLAGFATSLFLVAVWHPFFILSAMITLSLLAAMAIDLVRGRTRLEVGGVSAFLGWLRPRK